MLIIYFTDGSFHNLLCFVKRTIQSAARSIEMATTIKILLCYFRTREIVHTPKAYPYQIVAFGVFTQRDAQSHALDLQRQIHQPFSVAFDEMEAAQILT